MDEEQPEPATRPAGEPRWPRGERAQSPARHLPSRGTVPRWMLGMLRAGERLRGWIGTPPPRSCSHLSHPRCARAVLSRVPSAWGLPPFPGSAEELWGSCCSCQPWGHGVTPDTAPPEPPGRS